jgi:hypothetical protein
LISFAGDGSSWLETNMSLLPRAAIKNRMVEDFIVDLFRFELARLGKSMTRGANSENAGIQRNERLDDYLALLEGFLRRE